MEAEDGGGGLEEEEEEEGEAWGGGAGEEVHWSVLGWPQYRIDMESQEISIDIRTQSRLKSKYL